MCLFVSVSLVSCSGTTFIYNRLGMILPWFLERYVDLDDAQADAFDARLEPLLEWHRYEELPLYADFLSRAEAELDHTITVATVEAYSDEMEIAWYRIRDRFLDELLLLGASLSDEQIDGFMEELDKKQRKYERKYLDRDDEEFRDEAYDEMKDSISDFLGRLDGAQKQRLRDAAGELRRSDETWLSERAEWVDTLRGQLRREPGWEERVRSDIENWESELDPQSLALYEHNTRVVYSALVDVLNTRSERQDKRLRRKMADYREDFLALAEQ